LVDEADIVKAEKLGSDVVQFFREVVGFEPFAYQKEFIKLSQDN
jgi:hypothetical protein